MAIEVDQKLIFPDQFDLKGNPDYDDALMIYDAKAGKVKQTKMEAIQAAARNNVIGSMTPSGSPTGSEVAGQSYRVSNDSGADQTFENFLTNAPDGSGGFLPVVVPAKTGGYLTKNLDGWAFVNNPSNVSVIDNTHTYDPKSALSAKQGAELQNNINLATRYPSYIPIEWVLSNVKVMTMTGNGTAGTSYESNDFLAVTPGDIIAFTGACNGHLDADLQGVAGYSAANTDAFVSSLGSDGRPIGELWDNYRGLVAGVPFPPAGGYNIYIRQIIVIPEGVFYIRASSFKYLQALNIESVDLTGGDTLKQKQEALEEEIANISVNSYMERVAGIVKSYNSIPIPATPYGSTKPFCFLHYTDVHYDFAGTDNNLKELIDFSNHPLIKDDISAVICTGDLCNGQAGYPKATILGQLTNWINRHITSPKPAVATRGNHDDGINRDGNTSSTSGYANAISAAELYTGYFKQISDKWANIHYEVNTAYGYADFADEKTRVIMLDCYDTPLADNGDGSVKYGGGKYFGQAQLDWLYTTLNNTPIDYTVIMTIHCPLTSGYESGTYLQGITFMASVFDAFMNGTSYTHNYNGGAYPELATSKVFDFTTRGAGKRGFWLSGHLHSFNVLHPDGFPDQLMINMPCMKTDSQVNTSGLTDYKTSGLTRGDNDEIRNSFGFGSVNTYKNQVALVLYGAHRAQDGSNKKQVLILNY